MSASVTVNSLVLGFSIRQIRGHVMEQNLLCEDVLAIDDILICQIVVLAGHILNFPIRNILHCVNKIFYGCENAFRAALVSCVSIASIASSGMGSTL